MKKRITLLISEVYPILRLAFEQILTGQTEIELLGTAQNVDEAVQLCQLRQPDVLLLQWNPSCVETLHLLQTECPTTKVLMLIACSDAAESWKAISELPSILAAGARGIVSIDDSIPIIVAAMHAIAQDQRWTSPYLTSSLMNSHQPAVKPKATSQVDLMIYAQRLLTNSDTPLDLEVGQQFTSQVLFVREVIDKRCVLVFLLVRPISEILKLMMNIRLLLNTKKLSCHQNSLKLKFWWLTILLAAVSLTACMSGEQIEPHKSSSSPSHYAEILSRPLDCSLAEGFNKEVEAGTGYSSPHEAFENEKLEANSRLSGEPTLEIKEEDTVTWIYLDGENKIGQIRAVQIGDNLWVVTGGEYCVDD